MPAPEPRTPLIAFAEALSAGGLRAALGYLNGRTRHRFTGLYRFDPPMLRCVCLYDRENPAIAGCGDKPIDETYCALVERGGAPVVIGDAAVDPRLRAHPARTSLLAYVGVPVVAADGRCVGSLCHFDVRPRLLPATELTLLERVAPIVRAAVDAWRPRTVSAGGP